MQRQADRRDRRRKGSLHQELEAPLGSSGRGDGGRRGRDIQRRRGWGLQGCHALRAGVDQGKGRGAGAKGRLISDQGCKPGVGQPGVTPESTNTDYTAEPQVTWGPGSEVR